MIKPLVTLFAFGLLMLTPSMASAQKIRRISQMIVGDEVLIEIASTGPMEAPEIATAAGRVTLVMRAGLREMRPLSHDGDPQYVRLVQLRPRSSSSSTAYVLFNNETVVPSAENIRVDVLESGIVLHIPKSAFTAAPAPAATPAAPAAAAVAVAAAPAPVATPAAPIAPAPVVAAAAATPAARTAAAAAPANRTAQTTQAAPAAARAPLAARSAATAARPSAFAAAIPASAGPSAPVIIFLTVLLAGTYFALRQLLAKRQKSVAPAIDVVASKRLGARHQLLVVRAFGRDHLLSVQGSQTTRIASMKSAASARALLDSTALASESPAERSKRIDGLRDDDGLSLADLKIGRATEEPLRIPRTYPSSLRPAANDSIPAAPQSELRKKLHLDEETRFGAELLRMVKDSMPQRASVAPIKAESSVAGIARLKKQAIR